jgi:hypothetical protein
VRRAVGSEESHPVVESGATTARGVHAADIVRNDERLRNMQLLQWVVRMMMMLALYLIRVEAIG